MNLYLKFEDQLLRCRRLTFNKEMGVVIEYWKESQSVRAIYEPTNKISNLQLF